MPSFIIVLVLSFLTFACHALDYLVCVLIMHFGIVFSCLCVRELVFLCSVKFFCSYFVFSAVFENCVCILCYNRKCLFFVSFGYYVRVSCCMSDFCSELCWHVVLVLFDFVLCVVANCGTVVLILFAYIFHYRCVCL